VEAHNAMEIDAEHIASEQRFSLDLGDMVLEGRIDQINPLDGHADAPAVLALHGAARSESQGTKLDSSRSGSLFARGGNGSAEGCGERRKAGDALPEVELVDYKTGRPQSQKDADKSLQLSVYALAARRQLQLDPVRLTFYNLTNNQAVSTVRLAKGLDKALETIRDVADRIRRQVFDPKPGFVCKRCEFVPICPAHEEG
jgi:CRISPR/Cas system-associated exonuclease Cas4 (RecB family)